MMGEKLSGGEEGEETIDALIIHKVITIIGNTEEKEGEGSYGDLRKLDAGYEQRVTEKLQS